MLSTCIIINYFGSENIVIVHESYLGFHEILCFRKVKNKFAAKDSSEKSIIVELPDQVIFLPKYFSQKIKDNDIKNLNSNGITTYSYFGGQREQNKFSQVFFSLKIFTFIFCLFHISSWIIKIVSKVQMEQENKSQMEQDNMNKENTNDETAIESPSQEPIHNLHMMYNESNR